jgi:methionyl-tRNA formyltransferase
VHWAHNTKNLPVADFCFCLSFSELLTGDLRRQFRHVLVVHESNLPQGKGWSPLTWQILEGKSRIPVTLFEAEDNVDSGPIYAQRWIEFEGHELIGELRASQASATIELCRWFVDSYPESVLQAREQQGNESFYSRRSPKDSRLDLNKTLAEQFNHLRVADNDRYPAYFEIGSRRYELQIRGAKAK